MVRNGRVRAHQAVSFGGVVYLSGQVRLSLARAPGALPTSGHYLCLTSSASQVGSPENGDVAVQTVEILEKIDALLAANGSSKARILQATIWLCDMRHFTQMNAVWDAWVDQENAPARACVEARLATPGHLVEIQVTAAQGETAPQPSAVAEAAPAAAHVAPAAAASGPGDEVTPEAAAEAAKAKKRADRIARMKARDAEAGVVR